LSNSRRWLVIASACVACLVAAGPAAASGNDDNHDKGKDLQVYKTAEGTFKRAFSFKLEKWADPSYIASKYDKVKVHYKLKLTKSDPYDSDFTVSGAIKIFNPNKHKVKDVKVYDKIGYTDCKVYGHDDRIDAYSWAVFYYVCYVDGFKAGDYGRNVAVVKWDAKSIKSPHYSASAYADFKFDEPKEVKNDCTYVKDTLEGYTKNFGQFCYSAYIEYDRYLPVPKYGCKYFVNYAVETATGSTASATVTVCRAKKDDKDHYDD